MAAAAQMLQNLPTISALQRLLAVLATTLAGPGGGQQGWLVEAAIVARLLQVQPLMMRKRRTSGPRPPS